MGSPARSGSAQEEIRQWLANQSDQQDPPSAPRTVTRSRSSRTSSHERKGQAAVSAELIHHLLGHDLTGAAHGAQAEQDAETLRALEAMPAEAIVKGRGTLAPAAKSAAATIGKRQRSQAGKRARGLVGQTTGRSVHRGQVDERDPVARLLSMTRELCDAVEANNPSVAGLPGPMVAVLTGRMRTPHTRVSRPGRLVKAKRDYKLRPTGWCAVGARLMNQLGPNGGKYILEATTARRCVGTRKPGGRCDQLEGDTQTMRRINQMWKAMAAAPGGVQKRERLNARAAMAGAKTLLAWVPKLRAALTKTIAAAVGPLRSGTFIPGRDAGGEYVPDQYRQMALLLDAVEEAGKVLVSKAQEAIHRTRPRRQWRGFLRRRSAKKQKKRMGRPYRKRSTTVSSKRSSRTRTRSKRSSRPRLVKPSLPAIASRAAQLKPGDISPGGDTAAL